MTVYIIFASKPTKNSGSIVITFWEKIFLLIVFKNFVWGKKNVRPSLFGIRKVYKDNDRENQSLPNCD